MKGLLSSVFFLLICSNLKGDGQVQDEFQDLTSGDSMAVDYVYHDKVERYIKAANDKRAQILKEAETQKTKILKEANEEKANILDNANKEKDKILADAKNNKTPPREKKQKNHQPINPPSCFEKTFLESHAIADWLNSINIGSFFNFSNKYVRDLSECFAYFGCDENKSLWMEPYGFYSHYSSPVNKGKKIDFNLGSIGAGLGGMFNVSDEINVGGGMGYFYSSLKNEKDRFDTSINGVYFGPAVQYLFSEGSVGLSLFGIGNFYNGEGKVSSSKKKKMNYTAQSWDVDIRVEADYMLEAPADFFITNLTFRPFGRVDYLSVFEMSHQDKKERHPSFFYSKLGMGMERVIFCNPTGVLTSRMDLGWINMSPLSSSPIKCKTDKDKPFDAKPESKNQLLLGLGLLGMYKNGLLIGVDYSAALGANAPIQTGRVRFEWNW